MRVCIRTAIAIACMHLYLCAGIDPIVGADQRQRFQRGGWYGSTHFTMPECLFSHDSGQFEKFKTKCMHVGVIECNYAHVDLIDIIQYMLWCALPQNIHEGIWGIETFQPRTYTRVYLQFFLHVSFSMENYSGYSQSC